MLKAMSVRPSIGLLLNPAMERRLRQTVPSIPFTTLTDWLDLAFFDLESLPAAFVVDPALLPPEHRIQTMRRLGERRHVPVILYAQMTPDLAPILLEMGKLGLRHFMFFNVDDDRDVVRSVLASAVLHER
jgi:hypothetical protein